MTKRWLSLVGAALVAGALGCPPDQGSQNQRTQGGTNVPNATTGSKGTGPGGSTSGGAQPASPSTTGGIGQPPPSNEANRDREAGAPQRTSK